MSEQCLHGKTQNAKESFNGMVWNRVPRATHIGEHVLSVGVYDTIVHFNNAEKAALDILEFLKVDPGYYVKTSFCRSVNMRRKSSSIYRMSEKKKHRKVLRHSKKATRQKIETEGASNEKGSY